MAQRRRIRGTSCHGDRPPRSPPPPACSPPAGSRSSGLLPAERPTPPACSQGRLWGDPPKSPWQLGVADVRVRQRRPGGRERQGNLMGMAIARSEPTRSSTRGEGRGRKLAGSDLPAGGCEGGLAVADAGREGIPAASGPQSDWVHAVATPRPSWARKRTTGYACSSRASGCRTTSSTTRRREALTR